MDIGDDFTLEVFPFPKQDKGLLGSWYKVWIIYKLTIELLFFLFSHYLTYFQPISLVEEWLKGPRWVRVGRAWGNSLSSLW